MREVKKYNLGQLVWLNNFGVFVKGVITKVSSRELDSGIMEKLKNPEVHYLYEIFVFSSQEKVGPVSPLCISPVQ